MTDWTEETSQGMLDRHVKRLITETANDNRTIIGVWNIDSLTPEQLAQLRQRHEREFVAAKDCDAMLADRDATIARLREQWERECADTDRVLIGLGFSPETGRTEGGSLHLGRILAKCATLEHIQQRVIEADATIARLREANARLTAANDTMRHLYDGVLSDALRERDRRVTAEAALADRDATIARLRDELVKEELLHDEQLRRALTANDAEIARLREALGDADRDIHEWMRLARRQMVELPDWEHLPCGPTSAGLAESGAVRLRIREALTPAKEAE